MSNGLDKSFKIQPIKPDVSKRIESNGSILIHPDP
jgi:hypothetical protein